MKMFETHINISVIIAAASFHLFRLLTLAKARKINNSPYYFYLCFKNPLSYLHFEIINNKGAFTLEPLLRLLQNVPTYL